MTNGLGSTSPDGWLHERSGPSTLRPVTGSRRVVEEGEEDEEETAAAAVVKVEVEVEERRFDGR